jgi:hypothetical protein
MEWLSRFPPLSRDQLTWTELMKQRYRELPAQELLWETFSYNPLTGLLYWRETGRQAGYKTCNGYWGLQFQCHSYQQHRIVFSWLSSQPLSPYLQVDHINGVRLDNRGWNLRTATHQQNQMNKVDLNPHGFRGVTWYRRQQCWRAQIKHLGQKYHLGYFATAEEAHAAYCAKAVELRGEFAALDLQPSQTE